MEYKRTAQDKVQLEEIIYSNSLRELLLLVHFPHSISHRDTEVTQYSQTITEYFAILC